MEAARLKRLLQDTLSKANLVINKNPLTMENKERMGVLEIPLKGKFFGVNNKGDELYAMTPGNMPCLVPGKDITYNTPVIGRLEKDKQTLPILEK